jgi:tetratricopeptide (TPR) repeat protein
MDARNRGGADILHALGKAFMATVLAAALHTSALAGHEKDHVSEDGADLPGNARMFCIAETAAQHYEAAIRACDIALRTDPERAEVYSNRGVAWLMLGHAERAGNDFSAAIDISPANPLHYYNRALSEEYLGEWRAALADYGAAIERAPGLAIAYNNRGFVYERLGDHRLAAADYATAVAIDPKLAVAVQNLDRLSR